jgi:hypothetical protein
LAGNAKTGGYSAEIMSDAVDMVDLSDAPLQCRPERRRSFIYMVKNVCAAQLAGAHRPAKLPPSLTC